MSGLFKSIGKIFKKVVKVLKKVALPALAIAAVVVTGGAALGLLPGITGLGGLALSLGAPSALAGILSTAATGATIGFGTSLLTGGNPIKGATSGFIGGAIAGGVGQLAGGIGGAAGGAAPAAGAAGTAGQAATGASEVLGTLPATGQTITIPAAQAATGGIGQAAAAGATQAATSAVAQTAGRVATGGSGVLGFIERNPLIAANLMKGIGGAIQGDPAAEAAKRRRKSYEGVDFYQPYDVGDPNGQDAGQRYDGAVYGSGPFVYDPSTGTVRRQGN